MFQVSTPDATVPRSDFAHFSRPGSAYIIRQPQMQYSDSNMVNPLLLFTSHVMNPGVRKHGFGVSDKVRHKPACTATKDG